jgi:hypothetical protein
MSYLNTVSLGTYLSTKLKCFKGAHIDYTNGEGRNIFNILVLTVSRTDRLKLVNRFHPLPLKCLAARAVSRVSKDVKTPYYLESFVSAHKHSDYCD